MYKKTILVLIILLIIILYLLKIDEYFSIKKSNFYINKKSVNNIEWLYIYPKTKVKIVANNKNYEERFDTILLTNKSVIKDNYGPNGFCLRYKDTVYILKCSFFKTKTWNKYDINVKASKCDNFLIIESKKEEKFFRTNKYFDTIQCKF